MTELPPLNILGLPMVVAPIEGRCDADYWFERRFVLCQQTRGHEGHHSWATAHQACIWPQEGE